MREAVSIMIKEAVCLRFQLSQLILKYSGLSSASSPQQYIHITWVRGLGLAQPDQEITDDDETHIEHNNGRERHTR